MRWVLALSRVRVCVCVCCDPYTRLFFLSLAKLLPTHHTGASSTAWGGSGATHHRENSSQTSPIIRATWKAWESAGYQPRGFRFSSVGVETPKSAFPFIHQVMLMPRVWRPGVKNDSSKSTEP